MTRRIIIVNRKTGEEYSVLPKDYHKIYEPQGFEATVYEGDSGEPYEAPKRAEKPADKGGE